jgi:hypothetical protein
MMTAISLADPSYFSLSIGTRYLKQDITSDSSGVPVYSANVRTPFGYVAEANVEDLTKDYVLWGIDGDLGFSVMPRGKPFAATDHCGLIKICDAHILPEFLLYQLETQGHVLGFDRGLRASLSNIRAVTVNIPMTASGEPDSGRQAELVERYRTVQAVRSRLNQEALELEQIVIAVPQPGDQLTLRLGELFDLRVTTNRSWFTKRFVNEHPGSIPVYSASGFADQVGYGYVADHLPGVKYFEDILTWNIDGSLFRAFFRAGRFTLSEKVIPLVLHERWNGLIELDYIRHIIDRQAVEAGAAYQNKPGKGRIKDLQLTIPARVVDGKLAPDLDRQHALAAELASVEAAQAEIVARIRELLAAAVAI